VFWKRDPLVKRRSRVPVYKTRLKRRVEIAAGTMAFHFEKPEGFVFKAGQFGD
jgi:hypothetical protein